MPKNFAVQQGNPMRTRRLSPADYAFVLGGVALLCLAWTDIGSDRSRAAATYNPQRTFAEYPGTCFAPSKLNGRPVPLRSCD